MPITTPAEVREYFPHLETPSDDAKVAKYIADQDDLIAGYCGYPETTGLIHTMMSSAYDLYFSGPSPLERRALCVCVHPITAITSIYVDVAGVPTLLTAGTDYTFDANEGLIILTATSAFAWPVAWRGTRVQLTAGYVTTPPGLRAIACEAVAHAWLRRNDRGATSYSALGVSKTMSDPHSLLPEAVKNALLPYMTTCGLAKLQAAA